MNDRSRELLRLALATPAYRGKTVRTGGFAELRESGTRSLS
jgi:hypothetical protein